MEWRWDVSSKSAGFEGEGLGSRRGPALDLLGYLIA